MKDDKSQVLSAIMEPAPNPYVKPVRYGAFIGQNCIAIARVARKIDVLTEAALEDMKNHDGTGHIFRQTVLSQGIPYVGPKVASFAWLLLAPMTSQLATVDTHIMDLLGYNHKKDMSDRDYFRMERELQAGRDAAGYSHMPLGQFQWSLWDHKRTGPGTHQDHSPLRVWEPKPHYTVDWPPPIPSQGQKAEKYIPPDWWAITEPYRQNEVAKWNQDIAQYYPKNAVPWADHPAEVPHVAAARFNIIEHPSKHTPDKDRWFANRRPFLWDAKTNNIHMGDWGSHHGEMYDNNPDFNYGRMYEGMISRVPVSSGPVSWWELGEYPPEFREIEELMRARYPEINWEAPKDDAELWDLD